jgi:hypothetical protein
LASNLSTISAARARMAEISVGLAKSVSTKYPCVSNALTSSGASEPLVEHFDQDVFARIVMRAERGGDGGSRSDARDCDAFNRLHFL